MSDVAKYTDPDATKEITLKGVKFWVGYFPPSKADLINLQLARLRRMGVVDLEGAELEVAFKAMGLNRELCEEAVRYGVKRWEWTDAPAATFEGEALSSKCIRAITLAGLLFSLAGECMTFNELTPAEKKSSD